MQILGSTSITEYINVRERLEELGCILDEGFVLLPINLENAESVSEFRQRAESATVKTLLKSASLPCSQIFPLAERPAYVVNHSMEWVPPTLFLTATLVSQHPDYVAIALELIADYLTTTFPRIGRKKDIKLEIVVEKDEKGTSRKISYEGPPEGLKELAKIVTAAKDE